MSFRFRIERPNKEEAASLAWRYGAVVRAIGNVQPAYEVVNALARVLRLPLEGYPGTRAAQDCR